MLFRSLLVLTLIVLLVTYVAQYPKYKIDKVARSFLALFYVAYLLSYVYQTRCLEHGHWFVWLIVIGSWGSDTCAYVTGMLFGKHHFSDLSPKKTIEGLPERRR